MFYIKRIIPLLLLTFLLSGCYATSGKYYNRNQLQSPMTVYEGTIVDVRDVVIQEYQTGAGAVAGGVTGGIIGSSIGHHHHGSPVGFLIGSVIGAGIGAATERAATTRPGVELEVEIDDGRTMVIAQVKDDYYYVGDRVRILQSRDGRMRVRL